MYRIFVLFPPLLVTVILAACQPVAVSQQTSASEPVILTIASHDSFSVSEEIITAFEQEHNVTLQFLAMGDAGEALNKLILSQDAPLADVFFGVDNTFLSRALAEDLFTPYSSSLLDAIPNEYELDPEHRLLPVDYGFVTLNADQQWYAEAGLPVPMTLEDLVKPEYAEQLVVQNPATSSPGLAFLLATIGHFGEDNYLAFWQSLRENEVLVVDGWSEAYYEHFTVGSVGAGERPLCVSYSTSPPADVVYATDGRTEPASINISPPGGTFRQIEFVGILNGTAHLELAQQLVDYILDIPFQEDIPLQMFVYPVNENAELPDIFVEFGQVPSDPITLSPQVIDDNREAWIEAWTDVMLR